jgi:hypothetical protein
VGRARKVTRALKAGTVWVNCYNNIDPVLAFGGYHCIWERPLLLTANRLSEPRLPAPW